MTDDRRRRSEMATEWLVEGPTRAPDHLLATVLTQTSAASQRSAFAARLAGAPDGAPVGALTWPRTRLLLLIGAMALLAALAAVFVSSRLHRDKDLAVVPSPSTVSVISTDRPGRTVRPAITTPPASAAPLLLDRMIEDPDLRLSIGLPIEGQASPGPWRGSFGPQPGPPEGSWTIPMGGCSADLCAGYVVFTSADAELGAAIQVDGDPPTWTRISGTTLGEVRQSWVENMGPETQVNQGFLAGVPAIWSTTKSREVMLTVHDGRVFAVIWISGFILPGSHLADMDRVAGAMRFLDPPTPIPGDRRSLSTSGERSAGFSAVVATGAQTSAAGDRILVPLTASTSDSFFHGASMDASVEVIGDSLADARNSLLRVRQHLVSIDMTVGGDPAVLYVAQPGEPGPPVAFVTHGQVVYRIQIWRLDGVTPFGPTTNTIAGTDEEWMRRFLATFQAGDPA